MALITTGNLPAATLPVLGTDLMMITRDGIVLKKVTVADAMAGLVPSVSVATPNATVPVEALVATGAAASIDTAIVPKGAGAFALNVADNATTGGSKRGANAVDLQTSRTASAQVTSGAGSFAAGTANTVTGAAAAAIGATNTASGQASFAAGQFSNTNGIQGQVAFGHAADVSGRYQDTITGLRLTTTSAAATAMTTDGAAPAAANQLTLVNASARAVRARILAYDTVAGTAALWTVDNILIVRGASAAATTIVGTPTVTINQSSLTVTPTVTVTADTTNGSLRVTVSSGTTNAMRWQASLFANETQTL